MATMVSDTREQDAWREAGAFAESLADSARPIALAHFRGEFETTIKADGSPVTIADRSIEQVLRAHIADQYPDDRIFGEEFGAEIGATTWVVDPIDGTKSFVTGMPLFGTLIALAIDGRARLGVIDMPALDERWIGTPEGTYFNGALVGVSRCADLAQARLYTTSPDAFTPEGLAAFERLSAAVAIRRFGGDCYAYGMLANGYIDLVVEENLQPYDFMAPVAVVEGAGGIVSDWQGNPLSLRSAGRVIAAATPKLHREALAMLAKSGACA